MPSATRLARPMTRPVTRTGLLQAAGHRPRRPADHQEPGARQVRHLGGSAGRSGLATDRDHRRHQGHRRLGQGRRAAVLRRVRTARVPRLHRLRENVQRHSGPAVPPPSQGTVVNHHMSRPPDYTFYNGACFGHTTPWVGLNDLAVGIGTGIYAAQTDGELQLLDSKRPRRQLPARGLGLEPRPHLRLLRGHDRRTVPASPRTATAIWARCRSSSGSTARSTGSSTT